MNSARSTSSGSFFAYNVKKINHGMTIDCEWTKPEWEVIKKLKIQNDNGWRMDFRPETTVRICYNDEYLYIIYRVEDNFIRCLTNKTNGEVWKDSCVEFFFSPLDSKPRSYFNLEINCGGAIRLGYQRVPRIDNLLVTEEDIKEIKVFHSLPEKIEREIVSPREWFVEAALPIAMLEHYAQIMVPRSGIKWKANLYKCAENNSHPHWLSWTKIESTSPNFHLPEFFGEITFE